MKAFSILLATTIAAPSFAAAAAPWPCQSIYEKKSARIERSANRATDLSAVAFFTLVPLLLVGSLAVLAPVLGGAAVFAAPLVTMGTFGGGMELVQLRTDAFVDAYEVLVSADVPPEDLDEIYRESVMRYRQERIVDDEKVFSRILRRRNRERMENGEAPYTRAELAEIILSAPIPKRPRNGIEKLQAALERDLESTLSYERVRVAVLEVRETGELCAKGRPARMRALKKQVKAVL
jgi:hypothetical protein